MTESERSMIYSLAHDDILRAKLYARSIVENIKSEKDKAYKNSMMRLLDPRRTDLPPAVSNLLVLESSENYKSERFLLRDGDEKIVQKVKDLYKASETLHNMGINYNASLLLYGDSGCGKTELAKYIAWTLDMPFIYVNFSMLLDSYLGKTQQNLGNIFNYLRSGVQCVVCFDEIDAIGLKRGSETDVGEMSRVTIALMQELDRCPSNIVLIGTTNRFDRLDMALIRRFHIAHNVKPLTYEEAESLTIQYLLKTIGGKTEDMAEMCRYWFDGQSGIKTSAVIQKCNDVIVQYVLAEQAEKNKR